MESLRNELEEYIGGSKEGRYNIGEIKIKEEWFEKELVENEEDIKKNLVKIEEDGGGIEEKML